MTRLDDGSTREILRPPLTETEAATYVGMSRSFLRQDRMKNARGGEAVGPPWIKIGRSVRYLREDLEEWLMSHRIDVT
jgi:predicted DNA-binding transcriptional regulator AlpA